MATLRWPCCLNIKVMKTNNQNENNGNQQKDTVKQQQADQSQNKDRNASEKKAVYIKDLPPIDGVRTGII